MGCHSHDYVPLYTTPSPWAVGREFPAGLEDANCNLVKYLLRGPCDRELSWLLAVGLQLISH